MYFNLVTHLNLVEKCFELTINYDYLSKPTFTFLACF